MIRVQHPIATADERKRFLRFGPWPLAIALSLWLYAAIWYVASLAWALI